MGFLDKFKRANDTGKKDDDNFESQDGAGNFKYLSKLIMGGGHVVLDRDIILTNFEKRLYREGQPLLKDTVIDGAGHTIDTQGLKRMFVVQEKNIVLKNITFKNGFDDRGGAIFIDQHGSLEIKDCTFKDNKADFGGAIDNLGNVFLENVEFINNNSNEGSAFNNQPGGYATIKNCSFKENNSPNGYGTIVNFGTLNIVESDFKNNNSMLGGAINNNTDGTLEISKTNFLRNTSEKDGGAINNNQESSNLEVDDCQFIENRSEHGGGAIINWGNSIINNSEFKGNFSKTNGNDINFQKGILELSNVKFNYPKEKSIYSTNDDLVKIENCEFLEYDE